MVTFQGVQNQTIKH